PKPFDELFITVRLMKCDEAEALDAFCGRRAGSVLGCQLLQIASDIFPFSCQGPRRIRKLVEHGRCHALAHLDGFRLIDGVVLQGPPNCVAHVLVATFCSGDGLHEWMVENCVDTRLATELEER